MKKITNESLMNEIKKLNKNLDKLAKFLGQLPFVRIKEENGKINVVRRINTLNKLSLGESGYGIH